MTALSGARAEDLIREAGHGYSAHSRRPGCRVCGRPEAVHERTESGWLVDNLRPAEPVAHARLAAEAVRALNHVTAPGTARLTDAVHVDAVLTAVSALLGRLPQALRQCSAWLAEQDAAGRITTHTNTDTGSGGGGGWDVAVVMAEVHDLLDQGAGASEDLAALVDAARQHTSVMTGGIR